MCFCWTNFTASQVKHLILELFNNNNNYVIKEVKKEVFINFVILNKYVYVSITTGFLKLYENSYK